MSSPQARRRQRSTRLTLAVLLLVVASLAAAGAVLSGSWPLVTTAAVLGVLLGAAATRITHSELMATRRDAARDRAQQAQAYRDLTAARTVEHASYVANVQARMGRQEAALTELENALASAQQRAVAANRKFNVEARRAELAEQQGREVSLRLEAVEERAAEAGLRAAELEQEVDVLRAELDAWQAMPEVRKHA